MTEESTTIRVALEQQRQLRLLAEQRGSSMAETLDAAIAALSRELAFKQMALAEIELPTDEDSWEEFVRDRDRWIEAGIDLG